MVSKIPGYQNKEGGHEWEADSYIAEKADVEHLEGGVSVMEWGVVL